MAFFVTLVYGVYSRVHSKHVTRMHFCGDGVNSVVWTNMAIALIYSCRFVLCLGGRRRVNKCSVEKRTLQRAATSCAASMAAYGDASSRSAFTFIPPVTRTMVSLPDRSVMCCKSQQTHSNNQIARQCED